MIIVNERAGEIRCCGPCPEVTGNPEFVEGVLEYGCSGSACAGWRWLDVPNPAYQPLQSQIWPQAPNLPPTHIKSDTEGYCGLAGRP